VAVEARAKRSGREDAPTKGFGASSARTSADDDNTPTPLSPDAKRLDGPPDFWEGERWDSLGNAAYFAIFVVAGLAGTPLLRTRSHTLSVRSFLARVFVPFPQLSRVVWRPRRTTTAPWVLISKRGAALRRLWRARWPQRASRAQAQPRARRRCCERRCGV
jgi:hypothetical protein